MDDWEQANHLRVHDGSIDSIHWDEDQSLLMMKIEECDWEDEKGGIYQLNFLGARIERHDGIDHIGAITKGKGYGHLLDFDLSMEASRKVRCRIGMEVVTFPITPPPMQYVILDILAVDFRLETKTARKRI